MPTANGKLRYWYCLSILAGRLLMYDEFDILRLDKFDRGMMGPAAAKGLVFSCLQSGFGKLPVLDSVFYNNLLPLGTACL